jgi:hypothetical protein
MADLTPEKMLEYKDWIESFKTEEAARKLAEEGEVISKKPLATLGEATKDSLEKVKQEILEKEAAKKAEKLAIEGAKAEAEKVATERAKRAAYENLFKKAGTAEDVFEKVTSPSARKSAQESAEVFAKNLPKSNLLSTLGKVGKSAVKVLGPLGTIAQFLESEPSHSFEQEIKERDRLRLAAKTPQPTPESDTGIKPSVVQEEPSEEQEEIQEEIPKKQAYRPSETQPTDFKEEEKNTLEKMLAGASSRDLEERKKYSELLNRALEKRDFSEFAAQLGRATAQIGAGLGGAISKTEAAKPVGEDIYRQMIASSDKYVSDLEKKKALEIEERRMDPRSAESMAARAIIADLGIKVPETANAAFLEKQFPAISTLMARRELIASQKAREEERKEERMALREQREEERAEKRSERQKERLEKQVERFGSNKELQEQRAALTQMEAAETKIGEMINDPSFSLDTYKKKEFKADIPGVSLPFIGRTKFYDTDARELDTSFQTILNQAIKSFAGKAVTKNELERIKTQYEGGKFANERDFLQAFADVKKAIRRGISTGEKAYTKEALEEYENRGGRVVSKEKIGEEKYALKKPSTESRSKGFISKKTLEDYAKKYNISLEKAKENLKDYTHEE